MLVQLVSVEGLSFVGRAEPRQPLVPGCGESADRFRLDAGPFRHRPVILVRVEREAEPQVPYHRIPLLVDQRIALEEQVRQIGGGFHPGNGGDVPLNLLHERFQRFHLIRRGLIPIRSDGAPADPAVHAHRRTGVVALEFPELPLAGKHPERIVHAETEGVCDVALPGTGFKAIGHPYFLVLFLIEVAIIQV